MAYIAAVIDVWQTRGTKFHARSDCPSLLAGQDKAASEGRPTYAPILRPIEQVQTEFEPCATCWHEEDRWIDGWLSQELKAEHHSSRRDGSIYEPLFLREVLQKLPLNPNHVTVQDIVERRFGPPFRPDFTVRLPGCQPLAIEVDGDKEKWFKGAPTREDANRRDDELRSMGWRVIHVTNTELTNDPDRCRARVDLELREISEAANAHWQVDAQPNEFEKTRAQSQDGATGDASGMRIGVGVFAAALVALALIAFVRADDSRSGNPGGGGSVTADSSGDCPEAAPIKGNVSETGERIFHEPGWEFYNITNAEACFATPEDAQADGYRPSERR